MFSTQNPGSCTPKWMPPQGELIVVSAWAWDVLFSTDYSTEAGDDGCVRIRGWKRIVNRMNIKHGDKLFSILHNGMWGVYWFFFSFHLVVVISRLVRSCCQKLCCWI